MMMITALVVLGGAPQLSGTLGAFSGDELRGIAAAPGETIAVGPYRGLTPYEIFVNSQTANDVSSSSESLGPSFGGLSLRFQARTRRPPARPPAPPAHGPPPPPRYPRPSS